MSSAPPQTTLAAAGFDRHTELLLACSPHLHATDIARLWASCKELRAACRAVAQQQFPRLLGELLSELIRTRRLQQRHLQQRHLQQCLARRAAALSWLCDMAGRAAVAAASQQCLDQGCHENGLTEEDVRLLAAHGARVTCQMVVGAARRGVNGAVVWLRAGVVDDAPDLLQWASVGDPAHVERLRDLLYNADQLPPQQQLSDALQLAANMMSHWSLQQRQGLGLLEALLTPPISLSSGANPDARKQQLLALVSAADLERLLPAAILMDGNDGAEVATALCRCPAAGQLPGAAVLGVLQAAVDSYGDAGLVSALRRLPGAAEMPLEKVPDLLTGGEGGARDYGNDDAVAALLDMARVQQAITADMADKLLRSAVKWELDEDSSMVAVVRNTVVAGLVNTRGLAAAMAQCWMGGRQEPCEVWQQLWSFPAAEEMSPVQLHSVLMEAAIGGCWEGTMLQVVKDNPFVQQRVDWPGLLQAVAHELCTTSSDVTKHDLRGQLVLLVSLQAGKRTISEWQVTELLQAVIEAQCFTDDDDWLLDDVLRGKLSSPSVLLLLKHAVLHGADGTMMRDLCECPAAAGVPVSDLCDVARSLVQQQAGKQALRALRRLLLKVPGVPADVLACLTT